MHRTQAESITTGPRWMGKSLSLQLGVLNLQIHLAGAYPRETYPGVTVSLHHGERRHLRIPVQL